VAVKVSVLPTVRLVDDLFRVTPVTFTEAAVTVTEQVAVLLPSTVVTVIVALPADTAVTKPLDDTVATAEALLLHDTFWLVALEGATVAVNVSVPPTVRLVDVLFKVTPVTDTGVTVTVQVAVLFPSAVVTVMVALPADTAVIKPLDETDAMAEALLLHDTFWLVALEGVIVAVNDSVLPMTRLVDVLFKETPVTATALALTVTAQVADLLPSAEVTVMVALPTDTAVTKPFDETVATEVALLLHDAFLFVALKGAMVAVNVSVPPTVRLVEVLLRDTPVTVTALTLTAQVAALLPSAVVTVIVALPAATAVTKPLDDTVAMAGALLLHDTF
jgi:hypothetical protein